MAHRDETAKMFEEELTSQFAEGLRSRRRALGLTALELSQRTKAFGYPVSRGTIAKIESNSRAGKLDVAEWLVFSAALDIPPILLLFPDFRFGFSTTVLPNIQSTAEEAVNWVAGLGVRPTTVLGNPAARRDIYSNEGMLLIAAMREIDDLYRQRLAAMSRLDQLGAGSSDDETQVLRQMLQLNKSRIDLATRGLWESSKALWGMDIRADQSEDDPDE